MKAELGLRYRQVLTEHFPQLLDDIAIPENLKWDRRPTDVGGEAFGAAMRARTRRLGRRGAETGLWSICKRAFERASNETTNFGDLWDRDRAALQIEALNAEQIEAIVWIGRRRGRAGLSIWEVPIYDEDAEQSSTS